MQSIFIGVAVDYKLANKQRITNKEALSSCWYLIIRRRTIKISALENILIFFGKVRTIILLHKFVSTISKYKSNDSLKILALYLKFNSESCLFTIILRNSEK